MACLTPPRAALALLRIIVPPGNRVMLEGDLLEEFLTVEEPRRASWYWNQVFHSVVPLLAMRRRQPDWYTAFSTFLIYAIPVRLLDFLWAFVLSQVPLKEDAIRPVMFLAVHLTVACLFAITAQAALRRCNVVWVMLASLFILSSVPALLPLWFWLMLIAVPPACSAAFSVFRSKAS